MLITKELLVSKKACSYQVALFKKTFPSGAKVTKKNCLIAAKVELDITWAANNLLTESQRKIYEESEAQAWTIYLESTAPAWKIYEESEAQAWEIYKESTAPAWKIYEESRALAFYNACKQ